MTADLTLQEWIDSMLLLAEFFEHHSDQSIQKMWGSPVWPRGKFGAKKMGCAEQRFAWKVVQTSCFFRKFVEEF